MNKKQLALELSKLDEFTSPNVKLEQYPTTSEIAADALWQINLDKNIKDKVIADFGCGHGVLGIGALILGAKKVYFVDVDKDALSIAKTNLKSLNKNFKSYFMNKNIKDVKIKTDIVIQNPPFGVKSTHSDKIFLLKAMETAPVIYSFHKYSTKKFVESFCKDHNFTPRLIQRYKFPLKRSMFFHIKRVHLVDVGVWRITKN
ncbi:DNA methylase [Candidatus Woesearchaeota archaeon]|nr:MAG: DNA methylase [Candidatus Woesearchaeota archaeon]